MDEHIRIAWEAGIFDGEGCILISKRRNTYTPYLSVANTCRQIPQHFYDQYGGSLAEKIEKKGRRQRCWSWLLNNSIGADILKQYLPYLLAHKQRAILAIEVQDFKRNNVSKGRWPLPGAIELLEEYREKIHQMNQFGEDM